MDLHKFEEEQLMEDYQILKELEEALRCASDPRERRKYNNAIEERKQTIREREATVKILEQDGKNKPINQQIFIPFLEPNSFIINPIPLDQRPIPHREHPVFVNIYPQAGSLGLYKQSLPTQAELKPAQAGFVCVAATSVVRHSDTTPLESPSNQYPSGNDPQKPEEKLHADYCQLRKLLDERRWREADQETTTILLNISDRYQYSWLRTEDIEKFPSSDLREINNLWSNSSNNRFSFSRQKQIWNELGGKPGEFDGAIFRKFGDRVGWRMTNEWLKYDNFKFTLDAPPGHLPSLRLLGRDQDMNWWGSWQDSFKGFLSRVAICL